MKELPELDDDFAQDVSDCDTLEEYKEDLKKKLQESKEEAAKRAVEEDVVNQIIENAAMDIPEPMINMQTNQMIREFAQNLQYQGLSVEQYMQFTGMTQQSLVEEIQPQALSALRAVLYWKLLQRQKELMQRKKKSRRSWKTWQLCTS